tara:strand:- start:341 stop:499 length:159 start_codon:yes stop_codon:yes gene_type:complete
MEAIVAWVTGMISAASLIAALTPTPRDDNLLKRLVQFINMLALNFGNAKNAD